MHEELIRILASGKSDAATFFASHSRARALGTTMMSLILLSIWTVVSMDIVWAVLTVIVVAILSILSVRHMRPVLSIRTHEGEISDLTHCTGDVLFEYRRPALSWGVLRNAQIGSTFLYVVAYFFFLNAIPSAPVILNYVALLASLTTLSLVPLLPLVCSIPRHLCKTTFNAVLRKDSPDDVLPNVDRATVRIRVSILDVIWYARQTDTDLVAALVEHVNNAISTQSSGSLSALTDSPSRG